MRIKHSHAFKREISCRFWMLSEFVLKIAITLLENNSIHMWREVWRLAGARDDDRPAARGREGVPSGAILLVILVSHVKIKKWDPDF